MSDQQPRSARWEQGLSRPFRFDPNSTEHEGRWRLYPPEDIAEQTYWRSDKAGKRSANVVGEVPVTPGVSYVRGRTKGERRFVVQAIRFDKATFTEAKARTWWEQHREQFVFADELDTQRPPVETVRKVIDLLRTLAGWAGLRKREIKTRPSTTHGERG